MRIFTLFVPQYRPADSFGQTPTPHARKVIAKFEKTLRDAATYLVKTEGGVSDLVAQPINEHAPLLRRYDVAAEGPGVMLLAGTAAFEAFGPHCFIFHAGKAETVTGDLLVEIETGLHEWGSDE